MLSGSLLERHGAAAPRQRPSCPFGLALGLPIGLAGRAARAAAKAASDHAGDRAVLHDSPISSLSAGSAGPGAGHVPQVHGLEADLHDPEAVADELALPDP